MRVLTVEVQIPDDVPLDYVREYIQSALRYWGGQCHMDDPLFRGLHVTRKQIKLKRPSP